VPFSCFFFCQHKKLLMIDSLPLYSEELNPSECKKKPKKAAGHLAPLYCTARLRDTTTSIKFIQDFSLEKVILLSIRLYNSICTVQSQAQTFSPDYTNHS